MARFLPRSLPPFKNFGLADTDRKALAKVALRGYAADAADRGMRRIWVWVCPPGKVSGVAPFLAAGHDRLLLHMTWY